MFSNHLSLEFILSILLQEKKKYLSNFIDMSSFFQAFLKTTKQTFWKYIKTVKPIWWSTFYETSHKM